MAEFSRRSFCTGLDVSLWGVPKICTPLPSRAFGALTSAQGDNIHAASNSPCRARHGARPGLRWSSPVAQDLSSGPCFLPLELYSGPSMRQVSVYPSPAYSHTSEGEVSRTPSLPTQKRHAAKRRAIHPSDQGPQGEGRSPSPEDCVPPDDLVQDTCDILHKLGFICVEGDWFLRTVPRPTKLDFAAARENVQACRRAGLSTDSIVKACRERKNAIGGDPDQIQQTLDFIWGHGVPKQSLAAALINIGGLQEFGRLAPKVEFLRSLEVDPSRLLLKEKYMWCRPVQSVEDTISALSLLIGREEALQLFRDYPGFLKQSMKDLQETTNEVDRVLGRGSMRELVQKNKSILKSAGGVVPEMLRVLRSKLCFTPEELRTVLRGCTAFPKPGEVETRLQLLASTLGTENTKALLLKMPVCLGHARNVLEVFGAVSEMLKKEEAMLILKSNPYVYKKPWSTCVEPTLRLLRDHNEALSYERVLKAGIWKYALKHLGSRLKFLEEQGVKVVLSKAQVATARAQDSTLVVTIWPLIGPKKQFRKKFPDYQGS